MTDDASIIRVSGIKAAVVNLVLGLYFLAGTVANHQALFADLTLLDLLALFHLNVRLDAVRELDNLASCLIGREHVAPSAVDTFRSIALSAG